MLSIFADDAGRSVVLVAGDVLVPEHSFGLDADLDPLVATGSPQRALLNRFQAYQRLLDAGRLDEALAFYAPGEATKRAQTKFEEDPASQKKQRAELSIKIIGSGIAGSLATVWYEMIGPTLPGGRFPWLDQWRMVDQEWRLDPTIPINHPATALLAACFEAKKAGEPLVSTAVQDYAFFAIPGPGIRLLDAKAVADLTAPPTEPILALRRSLLAQRPVSIDSLDKPESSALRVLADAYGAVRSGAADTAAYFSLSPGRKLDPKPFGWGAAAPLDHLYGSAENAQHAFVLIGTATKVERTVVPSRIPGGPWADRPVEHDAGHP